VRPGPDRAREDDEDAEQDDRDDDRPAGRHERQERDERQCGEEHRRPVRPCDEVLVDRPERDQGEGVRLRRLADEALVGEGDDEAERDGRADDERDPRPWRAELDPGGEHRNEERREKEEVPVLDAVRGEP
jgi:hypothetical protein